MHVAYWLLTWRTYGTWLPGDARGFISHVRGTDGAGMRHNIPGTACDYNIPALERYVRSQMKGKPILLTADQAALAAEEMQHSAHHSGWTMTALAMMVNHVHLIVAAPEDVLPDRLFQIFKSYASRKLNQHYPKPPGGTWWAVSGSRRRLPTERALHAAIEYVKNQEHPLRLWTADSEPVM